MSKKVLALHGLKFNPFSSQLPTDALWISPPIESFCWRIEHQIGEGGFALVTGDPGTGKSAALRLLSDRLARVRDLAVGVLTRPQASLADFYRELGHLFGVALSPHNRWASAKVLREKWLQHQDTSLARPVLLVDEAQENDLPRLVQAFVLRESAWDKWAARDAATEWGEKWWFADAAAVRANDFNLSSAGRYRPMSHAQVEHRDPRELLDELAAIEVEIAAEVAALQRCSIGEASMTVVSVGDLMLSDESGFACSKTKLVSEGLPHLRPFNITGDGSLDLTQLYRVPTSEAPASKRELLPGDVLFVDLLARADGIVRLRREVQQKAAELIPAIFISAIFIDMFGDPTANPRAWPRQPLSAVAEVISGVAKGRKLAPSEVVELPYMRVANVKDSYLDLAEVKTIEIRRSEVEKLLIRHGDLLMTEGGDPDKLGRAALWSGEIETCVYQNHVFKVRRDRARLSPAYLRTLAGSAYGKAYFLSVAKKTTGIASINKTQLCAFPVPLPPLPLQRAFEHRVQSAESILKQQAEALRKATATFNALLSQAFH